MTGRRKETDQARAIEIAQRDTEAVRMRRGGATYEEIAQALGYASRGEAHNRIKLRLVQARDEMYTETNLYRAEQLDRLMALLHAVWPMAMAGSDKHVSEARRIVSDISDLTGAKSPVKVEIGEGDVDSLLARLDAAIAERTRTVEGEVVPRQIEG
jgi:hypothetical protein